MAPLTKRQCVYWSVVAREVFASLQSCERGSRDQGAPFLLVDGGGHARVIPDGARVALPSETRLRAVGPVVSGEFNRPGIWGDVDSDEMSGDEHALYESLQIRIAKSSRVRLTEYVIEPEMAIVVQGHAEPEPDDQAAEVGYREAGTRLVVSSARRAPLLIGLSPRP
ncbi:MAG: hypothetical protein IPQ07_27570 [Myxococcales bacterium]|nr:hypothetical protein [Myxococcales bacterium]